MPEGILRIRGSLDLRQLWPRGPSDADTLRVHLARDAFAFALHPGARFRVTHVFERAVVHGRVRVPVVRRGGVIVVRLETLDAPELHYTPRVAAPVRRDAPSGSFRQPHGRHAARALAMRLARYGRSVLPCVVSTRVDAPSEVFDTYGRCVGRITVLPPGAPPLDLNAWLLAHGWALPALYTGLRDEERAAATALARDARAHHRGVWPRYTRRLSDATRSLRPSRAPADAPDDGPVVLPWIFRRRTEWRFSSAREASFARFLARHDAPLAPTALLARGRLRVPPEALVFREAPSALRGPRGGALTGC